MSSIRLARTAKSAIAVAVSGALFLSSAGWPASRAFAQTFRGSAAGEGASAPRAVAPVAVGVAPVSAQSFASASLAPSFSAAPAPSALPNAASARATAVPAASAAALASRAAAAAAPERGTPASGSESARPASQTPAPAGESGGPRWVESGDGAKDAPAPGENSGPRWVKIGGLKAWVGRQLSRWSKASAADSRREFDGETARGGLSASAPGVAGAESALQPLARPSAKIDAVVDDYSIPTPEAARRVGEMRHEHGTPLWAKVAAPVAVIAAAVAAVHFGAVPVLTLGVGLVLSVLAHEVAHVAVLRALGDRTAEHAGESSLNPFHHIDAVKTVIVPAITLALSSALLPFPVLIGAGKPVDADFNNLRSPFGGPRSARNAFWVAAAGPLTNFALAGLALGAAALLPAGGILAGVALGLAHMNAALGVFNLLPLPQLDGGKMLASVLPERFYAGWVYSPNVEKGYQGMFRRLYEGPANLLTFVADKLGVKSQKTLNRVANGVTFTALAAFYAVAYFHFAVAVPLLFLALPCTYDYWCIREKVRSEAAVNDLMKLYSEWAATIAAIAEDKGMGEVDKFEAEHAMKNALETLVDEMMAKEDFRALPDDAKLEAIMKAYPEKAAQFLKDKVFTEPGDTLEKVRELLADPRNEPFMNRLRKWFEDHDVFARWDNPKYEGKLRDAIESAGKDKGKTRSQGGSTTLGMMLLLGGLGGASLLFPELAHHLPAFAAGGLGLLGLAGTLSPSGRRAPIEESSSFGPGVVVIELSSPMLDSQLHDMIIGMSDELPAISDWQVRRDESAVGTVVGATLRFASAEDARRAAEAFAADATVARVVVSTRAPAPEDVLRGKLRPRPGDESMKVIVRFRPGTSADAARHALRQYAGAEGLGAGSRIVFKLPADDAQVAADIARDVGALDLVDMVSVPDAVFLALTGQAAAGAAPAEEPAAESPAVPAAETPATPAAEAAPAPQADEAAERAAREAAAKERAAQAEADAADAGAWQGKVKGREDAEHPHDVVVHWKAGVSPRAITLILKSFDSDYDVEVVSDYSARVKTRRTEAAAEVARSLAERKAVEKVEVSPEAHDKLLAGPLPEKVSSHGKEHYSTTALLATFAGEVTLDDVKRVLGRLGEKRIYKVGDAYVLKAASLDDAAGAAKALSKAEEVAAVAVHPNLAAKLEGRLVVPYLEAESYDPVQSFLVQFKDGTTDEQMESYAELRRLRLVFPQFRGKKGLALLEVPGTADARATRQMLVDETLDEGSLVAEIKPFKEQEGEAALVPSEAAKAKAAARAEASAAAAEAEKNPPRRDPAAEWLAFLQTRKMVDGTTLNDKQVKALSEYLRPVAKNPNEPRPPVVARTEEVKRMLPIVTSPRGMRNSVILVGEAGTGKTAVAEGLAEMIEDAEHASAKDSAAFLQFQRLKGRWLVELDINKILTAEDPVGTLSAILDLLPRFNDPNPARGNEVVVLMDEIQKFFLDNNGQKIANVLKGPLRDGKIAVIATTTRKEYKEFIEKDDAFRRRFEKIDVSEPTVEATITILRALKGFFQKLHDAAIPDESLVAAAKLADQFDKTNFNPDKAIKAVQDGAELSRPENLRAAITLDIRETWNQLTVAVNEARQALIDKGIASTLALPIEAYNRIADLIKKADALYSEREAVEGGKGQVTVDVVKRVIAQKTGIGSGQLNMGEEDAARYNEMEKTVGERVVNQEPAITAIANAIRRNKAGLSNPNRPMGKFLLTGPTGVGKTYLAKELARFLFKDPEAMTRFDMSEFMEEHAAMRLIGAPPSYVGFGNGGELTEAVRKKPYSVLLFDEVEKAHPKVFDMLLQILDDGRLTDSEGRTVDFKNTVIIMTSNAGMGTVDGEKYAKLLEKIEANNMSVEEKAAEAASVEADWDKEIDEAVSESLKARFRPEFLNRLDEDPRSKNKWIRVNRLRRRDISKIAQLQVKEFQHLLADRHDTDLVIDPSVIEFLSKEGFSPLYGARPMTAAIEKHIIDPLAKWILDEAAQGRKNVRGGLIKISYDGEKIVFAAEPKPEKKIERSVVAGAAEAMAAEVFSLIESLSGEGIGEEPSETLFDKILRSARPPAATAAASAEAVPAARAFFAPGAAASLPDGARAVAAASNRPKASDATFRAETKEIVAAMESKGWSQAARDAVAPPASAVGEGWIKQIAAFAKDKATAAGVEKPVELASSVTDGVVRLAVRADVELSDADKAYLAAHFTGTPPASYEAAQRMVDDLNLNSAIVRNHNLLDLYRRLRDLPSARMGYSSAGGRVELWLELRKEDPQPAAAPSLPKPAAAADGAPTPHQEKEMGRLKGLLLGFIDQSRLASGEQDGISIRIAAAEAFARLAGPADADLVRSWIAERGWSASAKLSADSPLAMTAALVLQRAGTPADIPLLEGVLGKTGELYGDAFTPLKTAFVLALAELYKRAGLAATREAVIRSAQIEKGSELVKQAAHRALGALGYPTDYDAVKSDGEALAELYRRMGRSSELLHELAGADWVRADATRKVAMLKTLGAEGEPSPANFDRLRGILQGDGAGSRQASYAAAQAWADLVARGRLSRGISDGIKRFLDERGVTTDDDAWAVQLAYVLALEKAGTPEDLPALESILNIETTLHYRHEQAYFAAPEAWAKVVVRSGRFAEYARPRLGADGAPKPSILMEMLANKSRPLMAAAALRAMALARDPSFKEKPVVPAGDAPNIHPGKKTASSTPYYGGYSDGVPRPHGYRHDHLMLRFERWPPAY